MRAVLVVLVVLAFPAAASADTVGTATTTTGQTLTISIETPYDGVVVYGASAATMQGHVTVSGDGNGSTTSVSGVKIGIGDAYEAPGSTDYGDASYYPTMDHWETFNKIAFEGTRTLYATAIAADGTRATANLTITLDPKQKWDVTAFGVLYDDRLGGPTGALQASITFDRAPRFGTPIDFFIKGEKVCSGAIGDPDVLGQTTVFARCTDPLAVAKAVAAGGYEARYEGTQYSYPASDSAGLIVGN